MEKDKFNEWYRDRFNRLDEQPPADAWEGIANELDVQEVWERVDNKLTASELRIVFRKRLAWAASLLLLLAGAAFLKYSLDKKDEQFADRKNTTIIYIRPEQGNSSTGHSSSAVNYGQHSLAAPNGNKVQPQHPEHPGKVKDASLEKTLNRNNAQDGSSPVAFSNKKNEKQVHRENKKQNDTPGSDNIVSSQAVQETRLAVDSVLLEAITHNSIAIDAASMEIASSFTHIPADSFYAAYKPVSAGLSAGPTGAINNVWLLNRTTISGLKSTALYQTDLTFGASYGASMVYDTKGKWGIQADVMLDETQGQGYHYYDEGAYVAKIISAHYYQLGILARKKKATRFFSTAMPASSVWSFGPEMRWMKSLFIDINRPGKSREANFARFDYGVRFGYEYELQVQRRLILSSGIGASIGLNNVNRGQSTEPGTFNSTYNAAAGLQLGVHYLLSAK